MDEIDRKTIALLQQDGRKPNTAISRHLGVSEATVRKRINRLVKSKVLQVTAVTDPYVLGFTLWVQLGIRADLDKVDVIARQLSAFPEVFFVCVTTGEYDLVLAAVFRSNEELYEFLTRRLGKIKGVQRTFTSHILRIVKRTFAYGLTGGRGHVSRRDGNHGR